MLAIANHAGDIAECGSEGVGGIGDNRRHAGKNQRGKGDAAAATGQRIHRAADQSGDKKQDGFHSNVQLNHHRHMVRGFFPIACVAVNVEAVKPVCRQRREQMMVNTNAVILRPSPGLVIPEMYRCRRRFVLMRPLPRSGPD